MGVVRAGDAGAATAWARMQHVTVRILLTNDDGIDAPGLAVARRALEGLGEVVTIAPAGDASAVARAITIDRALTVQRCRFGDGREGFACDGTPVDCVRVGLLGVVAPRPDLVVAGVNLGANMGADVTYSGTVGAALEAALRGLPALAFSVESRAPGWLDEAVPLIRHLVGEVLRRGLPSHVALNVNLPDRPLAAMGGVCLARVGGNSMHDRVVLADDGRAGAVSEYLVPCDGPPSAAGLPSDFEVVAAGEVAVTPLSYDLADEATLTVLAGWDLAPEVPCG